MAKKEKHTAETEHQQHVGTIMSGTWSVARDDVDMSTWGPVCKWVLVPSST